jgi:CHAT domain-containing protein/tetratricopeptide (TPR) repeat protein
VRFKIASSLLFVLIFALPDATSSQTWKELYAEADSLYKHTSPLKAKIPLELARKALELVEEEFGPKDTNVARALDLYAELLYLVERDAKPALAFSERALAIKEELLGSDHIEVAKTLDLLATLREEAGAQNGGDRLRARGISIFESAHATENRYYAAALHNMAASYASRGNYPKAQQLYEQALEIFRRVLPPGDIHAGYTVTMLAMNYLQQGFYNESEELLQEALRNCITLFGPEDGITAAAMGNLTGLYRAQGKFDEAEALAKRALDLAKVALRGDPLLARWYFALGSILTQQGKYTEAIDTLGRALAIWDAAKEGGWRVISSIHLIGECHLGQRDYAGALAQFERALALHDSLASDEEARADTYLLMAKVLARTNKVVTADSLLDVAQKTREKFLGTHNPQVAEVLDARSECLRIMQKLAQAVETSRQAVVIHNKNFLRNVRMMSEKDALSFSMFLRRSLNHYLSAAIDARAFDSSAGKEIADLIVSTKGQIAEQAILRRRGLVTERDSATLALAEEYRYARFQLSTLYVEGPGRKPTEKFRREIDSLDNVANELEASLARKSASFAASQYDQRVTVEKIASRLPNSSTLVEYLKIDYVSLSPDRLIPRYIALTIDPLGKSQFIDLGEAEQIDGIIEEYRNHFAKLVSLRKPLGKKEENRFQKLSSHLYTLIWKPIEQSFTQRGTVFIAPDGGLNLVSFSGLLSGDGTYLIEKHPIQYLSAGRDVLRLDDKSTHATGLLAFGDPDFDANVSERISSTPQLAASLTTINPYQVRNVRSGCEMLNELKVPRLHNTRTEIESITDFWRKGTSTEYAEAFVGAKASEERFKQELLGKRAIHIATHGYFLQASCMTKTNDNTIVGENPLLQSGLLLAGANLHGKGAREAGAEDGILTALEVSAMDLRGTDLVVLSACETGLGKVEQGEGVYGLRRAFQMAGAKTVVSSLWQVPDDETMKFMKTLYVQLTAVGRGGSTPYTYPELMQQVALKRINEARLRGRSTHPFTWGAFVATGEWRIK